MPCILPTLTGGLGNVLFGLSSAYGMARTSNIQFFINILQYRPSHHSSTSYFENLLQKWKMFHNSIRPNSVHSEYKLHPVRININQNDVITVNGYLQNFRYFWEYKQDIYNLLSFDTSVASAYTKLDESAFIHVRGGDYVGHPLHHVDLLTYYASAIKTVNAPHYYVFTNDVGYLNTQPWLRDINYTVVNENEVDSLYLMSQCKKGAICANSTFSWWGAVLNTDRIITLPSKWFNNPEYYIEGYFFPGATIVSV